MSASAVPQEISISFIIQSNWSRGMNMKRIALALMFFILIPSLCLSILTSAIAADNGLELKMTVDRDKVPRGTKIDFTLTLTNIGLSEITITFSSGQAFDLSYYTSTGWHRWSDGKAFVLFVWDVKLKPGEHFSQTLEWDLYQYNRISGKFIPPEYGTYDVLGTCEGVLGAITSSPTTITLYVPGDANVDHIVNSLDISTLNAHWAPAGGAPPWSLGYDPKADCNDDGYVNALDTGVVNAHWGQTW